MRRLIFFLLILLLLAPSWAATFTVTNCATSKDQVGTLAWAINQARLASLPDISYVHFNIPQTEAGFITAEGVWCIQPVDADLLDLNRDSLVILGSTQTQNQGDLNPFGPEIVIDGTNITVTEPLIKITDNNECSIEGVVLTNSKSDGIYIATGNLNHVYNCYIGTNSSGEAAQPNAGNGIRLDHASRCIIGGASTSLRNLISGNTLNGIDFLHATNTQVKGNYIGTTRSGATALKNQKAGLYLEDNASSQYIAAGNIIAFNGEEGIKLNDSGSIHNTIAQNSFFSNTLKGINLNGAGNLNLPATAISTAEFYGAPFNVLYVMGSGAPAGGTIEILEVENPEVDPAGEGKTSLGFARADSAGNWLVYLGTNEVQAGDRVTALSTDTNGNTSEFSLNISAITGTVIYRPDGMIANLSDGTDYVGADIYNTTGDDQSKSKSILNSQAAIYCIKVKNAGNISPDNILITGTGDSTDWQVKYYDAKTGGNDITAQVTGTGYQTTSIPSAESYEFRAEVISTGTTASNKEIFVNMASASNTTRRDVVKAVTSAAVPPVTNNYYFEMSIPTTCEVNKAFPITITARNPAGQVTTEVVGTSTLAVDAGTISQTSIGASAFSASGIWSGYVSLSLVGNRTISLTNPSITTTATAQIEIQIPPDVLSGGLMRFGPNPFNPNLGQDAVFWYWLNEDKATDIYIFDMYGNNIYKQTYLSGGGGASAGINSITWNGRNAFGEVLENGTYFFRVAQGGKIVFKGKIIILK